MVDEEPLELKAIVEDVQQWLNQVVIGLNLCPFAAEPKHNHQIKIQVSTARNEEDLLMDLHAELMHLDRTPTSELETTLLVVPILFPEFEDYNNFLYLVDVLLKRFRWEGIYQIASVHPHYRFADTQPDDAENLTNRSPYPILHILREASVSKALASYSNPEQIPEKNIRTVQNLTPEQQQYLFPYL